VCFFVVLVGPSLFSSLRTELSGGVDTSAFPHVCRRKAEKVDEKKKTESRKKNKKDDQKRNREGKRTSIKRKQGGDERTK